MEINGGDWQGRAYDEIKKNSYQFREVWIKDLPNCVCDNGESVKDCGERVYNAVYDIAKNANEDNIIITSHGLAIRTILAKIYYGDIKHIDKLSFLVNAGISLLTYDNDKINVKELLITKHLGDLITKFPSNI